MRRMGIPCFPPEAKALPYRVLIIWTSFIIRVAATAVLPKDPSPSYRVFSSICDDAVDIVLLVKE
ncbi:Uncharacterized [Syntrophomonas zehnderi OL-4]|uniref:Uncharacterized n=1 Tax=Syntrophomonas zehnderi OL-4 TaxID=690567 RepID=A0A0E4GCI2_9FIRM|nr:Uncharacterized [Syntrophomonas zehnderi OL-4]